MDSEDHADIKAMDIDGEEVILTTTVQRGFLKIFKYVTQPKFQYNLS